MFRAPGLLIHMAFQAAPRRPYTKVYQKTAAANLYFDCMMGCFLVVGHPHLQVVELLRASAVCKLILQTDGGPICFSEKSIYMRARPEARGKHGVCHSEALIPCEQTVPNSVNRAFPMCEALP